MLKNTVIQTLIFIIGLILFIDGLYLIALGRLGIGTILPFVIGLIFCIQILFGKQINHFLQHHLKLQRLWKFGWILFSIWLFSLFIFFGFLKYTSQQNIPHHKIDAIIVLGSGLINGEPSPILTSRLDRAAELAHSNPDALVVLTGGLGFMEKETEAEVMAGYLKATHALTNTLALEDQSTSTELNLKNSQHILTQYGLSQSSDIAIVTSDFHTIRAQAIAKKQGYQQSFSVSAETPLMTRYNAWLREYFAYLSGWVLQEY